MSSRGYLIDNYPLRIGWQKPGGWRISAADPMQQQVTEWIRSNRFDRQLFATRAHALEAASLALQIEAPMDRPEDAPCRYIKAGHWQLAHGLEARKEPSHHHWLIYQDGKAIQYTITLWRAARLAADRGELMHLKPLIR